MLMRIRGSNYVEPMPPFALKNVPVKPPNVELYKVHHKLNPVLLELRIVSVHRLL